MKTQLSTLTKAIRGVMTTSLVVGSAYVAATMAQEADENDSYEKIAVVGSRAALSC
jgi:hypothetical protein